MAGRRDSQVPTPSPTAMAGVDGWLVETALGGQNSLRIATLNEPGKTIIQLRNILLKQSPWASSCSFVVMSYPQVNGCDTLVIFLLTLIAMLLASPTANYCCNSTNRRDRAQQASGRGDSACERTCVGTPRAGVCVHGGAPVGCRTAAGCLKTTAKSETAASPAELSPGLLASVTAPAGPAWPALPMLSGGRCLPLWRVAGQVGKGTCSAPRDRGRDKH